MMTARDYEVIAAVVKEARQYALTPEAKSKSVADFAIRLTGKMGDALLADNPRFNRHIFGIACCPETVRAPQD